MADTVSRIYSNFRGADFRGEEINLVRSPDCLNVWKDYKETDSIRTRPGLEMVYGTGEPVYGVWFYNGTMMVHSGATLSLLEDNLTNSANPARSNGFALSAITEGNGKSNTLNDAFFFMDGKNFLRYDKTGVKHVHEVAYVPTTTSERNPSGGGKPYEDINLLSDYRKNSFRADGTGKEYFLDTMSIDTDFAPVVTVNGTTQSTSSYKVDYTQGKITFTTAPEAPLTDGQDNVVITFKKSVPGYRDRILKCTLVQAFDNRVFFSGNPDYPNAVWHCSLNDPSYCSDQDCYYEGLDKAKINGLVAGNNALWVFREPSNADTTVFYHVPTIDEEYGKIYPYTHSSVTTGCVGKAINFNDDIVFFSERGMEGISGDVTTEQAIAHRSTLVDRKLTAEPDYKNMILEEWNGYLMVFIGNKVYLADSRTAFTNEDHIEYDWFYWELERPVYSTCVHDGVLYLGCDDGVYSLTDMTAPVKSYWTTPKDKFKHPHKLKTTNKRGCVAEATGDIAVYAKLEDTDFELIGEYKDVTDYFVSRIKRKKFKDIQLKFESNTRFSLETVTLEAFIGGYIKR